MLRILIAAALLLLAPPLYASVPTFKGDNVLVQLLDTKCPAKVLQLLQAQYHDRFQAARVVINGRELNACWTLEAGNVVIVDEDGDGGAIPAMAFQMEPGT